MLCVKKDGVNKGTYMNFYPGPWTHGLYAHSYFVANYFYMYALSILVTDLTWQLLMSLKNCGHGEG